MFLGIEIGGTKLQFAIGPGDGNLLGLSRGTVNPQDGGEGIRRQILAAVPELLASANVPRSRLRGVGIGFGGPIDDTTQCVIKSHQIAGWDQFPLPTWIGEALRLPAVLGNDADVAGLAEALFGAGQGLSPIFYVTVGSGIGGGLIVDGEIYRGVGRGAAEIGHLRIGDQRDGGTEYLPLEKIASGWGIGASARRRLERGDGVDSSLKGLAQVTAVDVAESAREGDAFALRVLRDCLAALAEALCSVIALLCPKRIVIGGGVSLMGEELFFQPLRAMVAERVFAPFAGLTEIVPAALGESVVVHGALALARQRLKG